MLNEKAINRFKQYSEDICKILNSGIQIIPDSPAEQMAQHCTSLINNVGDIWDDAKLLFDHEKYPRSCFLALVGMEECFKIYIACFQTLLKFIGKPRCNEMFGSEGKIVDKLRKHSKKQYLSAFAGALINDRMNNLFGSHQMSKYLHACHDGTIEIIRQKCVYSEMSSGVLSIPRASVNREKALFYICLTGEIFAETGGIVSPQAWGKILNEAKRFESKNGIPVANDSYFKP